MQDPQIQIHSELAMVAAAYLSNNEVPVGSLEEAINEIRLGLEGPEKVAEPVRPEPAVSIRASVKPDYIVCLEDGKKLKMLKRYLRTNFDMTPEEYRRRWNLPSHYPMVAPTYAEKRRDLAKKIGLGRKPGQKVGA